MVLFAIATGMFLLGHPVAAAWFLIIGGIITGIALAIVAAAARDN